MRLFPNQITAIESLVKSVVEDQKVLDAEIKIQIDLNKKWGGRDRRYFQQACYDLVRHYELFHYIATKNQTSRLTAYLNSLVDLHIDFEKIEIENPELTFGDRYSIPENLLEIYKAQAPNAEENLKAMQKAGPIFLRINTSMTKFEDFVKSLVKAEIAHKKIEEINYGDETISLSTIELEQSTHRSKAFFELNQNCYDIQDIGSQILTTLVDFQGVNMIIEACAGNGGKTSHIIDLTRNENPLIISMDSERKKLENLVLRIAKWKNHKVVTEKANDKDIAKYTNMADLLYLDVPCTGSGTLRRQADLKYRISNSLLEEKKELQRDILKKFHPTLKAGGQLIYTTCSLFRAENDDQVDWLISQGFELKKSLYLEPSKYNGDGFFFASLIKK
jgi:16S rRNA (cytosine967-C5)-methyltransferase